MTRRVLDIDMKHFVWILLFAASVATMNAAEHSYVWSDEFPNYKSQIPSSDFTTSDGLFRFTSEKANGVSGPQFGADSKAGLLLRLYADNTLRIESMSEVQITAITFVIGGNGHYKLTNLTPSNGVMGEPYLGKDATDTFREYRLFWSGDTRDVTFTVGHECVYGIDCAEQGKEGEPGTCMTKQMIITTTDGGQGMEQVQSDNVQCTKVVRDGQLYILRENKTYTIIGTQL